MLVVCWGGGGGFSTRSRDLNFEYEALYSTDLG